MRRLCLQAALVSLLTFRLGAAPESYFRAIRENNLDGIRELIRAYPKSVNEADKLGTSPLLYAAVAGSPESVDLLIKAGADLKQTNNSGATALILAAPSLPKVSMLVAAGADVNAFSKAGRTALIVAATCGESHRTVELLLNAGADPNRADEIGTTALQSAASQGDMKAVKLLLAKGAAADAPDKAGFTPIMGAVESNSDEMVRLLLARGAKINAMNTFAGRVKNGPIALTKVTPLILAAPFASSALIKELLAAGADVNAQDDRGVTPLIAALASDAENAKTVEILIKAGADVNAKDTLGVSALEWARRKGDPAIVRLLQSSARLEHGAAESKGPDKIARGLAKPRDPRSAVDVAMRLLTKSNGEFFKQSGCVGCHHQPVTALAVTALENERIPLPTGAKDEPLRAAGLLRPMEPALLQHLQIGGHVLTVGTALIGLKATAAPASSLTEAAVAYVASLQHEDGSWSEYGIARPPIGNSAVGRTKTAIRAMRTYPWPAREAEFDRRIARAVKWLRTVQPGTPFDKIEMLEALYWAGAPKEDQARAAEQLIKSQNEDGGWSQNRYLPSDAMATAYALATLHETKTLALDSLTYQRGINYLLKTQWEDGSWLVQSRSPKFQPYFESGFPHGHDQWISSTATAYAIMALAPAAGKQAIAELRP